MSKALQAANSGPLPQTPAHKADSTAFHLVPGRGAAKEPCTGNEQFLAAHPNVKGRSVTTIAQWPMYGDEPVAGMRHYAANPTFKSTSDLADAGAAPVPGQRAKFHVDWKSVRPEAHIMPYTDRQKEEQVKETARSQAAVARSDRLNTWDTYNKFDPISNRELVTSDQQSRWEASQNCGWVRDAMQGKGRAVLPSHEPSPVRQTQIDRQHEDRRAAIVRDGRDRQISNHVTMKQLLQWD